MATVKYVSLRQLQTQLAHYLRAVEAGDSLTVTVRNRPVAKVIPIRAQGKDTEEALNYIGRKRVCSGRRSGNLDRSSARLRSEMYGLQRPCWRIVVRYFDTQRVVQAVSEFEDELSALAPLREIFRSLGLLDCAVSLR